MKIKAYSFKCEKPLYVFFKKHYCPTCRNKLQRKKVSIIVSSDSPEAKDYNFDIADMAVKGNVKFNHIEFYCSKCNKHYTVQHLKTIGI